MFGLQDPSHPMWRLLSEYKEEMFGCSNSDAADETMACDKIPQREMEIRFKQDPQVTFVVRAVSALTAAFRLVQLDHCSEDIR